MVEWGGLENRCALTGTVGSNPTPSASRLVGPPVGEARPVWGGPVAARAGTFPRCAPFVVACTDC